MKRLLLTAAVLVLGGSAWAKAPLRPLHCYRFTELDANGGIAAVPNAGTVTDAALTRKVYSGNETVPALRDGDGEPMRNKFGSYSVFADGWSGNGTCTSYWLEGDETEGLGCSSGTGFAISLWFRPTETTKNWNDFFGFRLGDIVYDFEYNNEVDGFSVYDFLGGTQNLKNRNNASADASAAIRPNDWNHLCVVWQPYAAWRDWKHYGEVWVNGVKVAMLMPNGSDNSKNNCALRTIYLGGWLEMGWKDGEAAIKDDVQERSKTGIGEVAVFGCPISDDDVAYLYTHAAGPLPRGREMTVGLHFDRSWVNGGDGDSPTSLANSGTLRLPVELKADGGGSVNLATEDSGACGSGSGFKVKGAGTGTWFEGDATTGLGASSGTGLTLSYWTRVRDWSPAWSYVLSFGFGEGFDFYHDKISNGDAPEGEGGFAYYGDCELWDGTTQTFNDWHHHVLVLEPGGTAFQYWQDGERKGSVSFKNEMTDGLLRRFCIGPVIKNHGQAVEGADAWIGLDEVGVYNYAMSADEIAWLSTHEAGLPPLTVTTLARTVSADGQWAGMSAEWKLNGTDRKIVYPSGEDTASMVTVTADGTASLTVDTLVAASEIAFNGEGTIALSLADGCGFEPSKLTVGTGVTVGLPEGPFAGTVGGTGAIAGSCKLTGTWEIASLDNKTAKNYLSWPVDADLSEATVNVTVETGRRGQYTLVEGFTGKLPKKVLHQGSDDAVFRVVKTSDGKLVLRNRAACGLVILVQ